MAIENHKNIDEYLDQQPEETRKKLEEIRTLVRALVPEASEKIAYGIPTFTYHGNLLHFAGYKAHIGFYPGSTPVKQFEKELSGYETSKGTIKFPLSQPLPLSLIRKITLACVERNESKKKR